MYIKFINDKEFIIEYNVNISEIIFNKNIFGKVRDYIKGYISYETNEINFSTSNETVKIGIVRNIIKKLKNGNNKSKILLNILKSLLAFSILTNNLIYARDNTNIENYISKNKIEQIKKFSNTELYYILKTEFANDLDFVNKFNKLDKKSKLEVLKKTSKIFGNIKINENYKLIQDIQENIKIKIFYDSKNNLSDKEKIELETYYKIGIRKVLMKDLYILAKNLNMLDETGNFKPEFKKVLKEYFKNLEIEIYPTINATNENLSFVDKGSVMKNGLGGFMKTLDGNKYTIKLFVAGIENKKFLNFLKSSGLLEKYIGGTVNVAAHELMHSTRKIFNLLNGIKGKGKMKYDAYPEAVAIYAQNHTGIKSLNFDESYKILRFMLKENLIKNYILYSSSVRKFEKELQKTFNYVSDKKDINKLFVDNDYNLKYELYNKIKNKIIPYIQKNPADLAVRFQAVVMTEMFSNNRGFVPFYGEYQGITGLNKGKYADKIIKNIINHPNDTLLQEKLNNDINSNIRNAQIYSMIAKMFPDMLTVEEQKLLIKTTLYKIFNNYKKLYENVSFFDSIFNKTLKHEEEIFIENNKNFFNYIIEKAFENYNNNHFFVKNHSKVKISFS